MSTATLLTLLLCLSVEEPARSALRLPVSRDLWLSSFEGERDANLGGAPRLKFKSFQEFSLLDIDPAPLRGHVVRAVTLHLRQAGSERLHRVTVGSLAADWVEGTSSSYAPQVGSSSFRRRLHPDGLWAGPGSDLCSVMLGAGGTVWSMAEASPPDAQGWQRIAVAPEVLATRIAGVGYGFVVFDDTGSEWTREGEKWTTRPFPNRFFHSRESRPDSRPYWTVQLGPRDDQPPAAPEQLRTEPGEPLPPGEARLSWLTPADVGPAGTIGFLVRVAGKEIPRYLIPRAGQPGQRVTLHLRDLALKPGQSVQLAVRAVDAAGNVGPETTGTFAVSAHAIPTLPGKDRLLPVGKPLPKLGNVEVAILDELDKVHPQKGTLIPPQPADYLAGNHLWDGQTISLFAGRNEIVGFQVLLRGTTPGIRASLRFAGDHAPQVVLGRYQHVQTKQGPLPDPILPLKGALAVPTPEDNIEGQKSASLHVEVFVPHRARAGLHQASLVLESAEGTLRLPVRLTVWDFTLPDHLSFLPELNGYGLPASERLYYRMAHRHRCVVNIVPYSQRGTVTPGWVPTWDGKRFDWSAFDRRFGPYLDGSAFADLPRAGVPLECFYLGLHENWPTPMEGNYNGDYWADRAFPDRYRATLVEATRQHAVHFGERKWLQTRFHLFLNNKNNFKERGWSRGSSPWLLDEPAHFQDFWALRYFGEAFHEGIRAARSPAQLLYRADISRPMWQRDSLDGLLDYNVVSGEFRHYNRLVLDRKQANGQILLEYGGSIHVEGTNLQPAAWCLDAWTLGADGVIPWLAIGTPQAWKVGEDTCLFYPPRSGESDITPSIRLKAYLRGQQDVEYLTLWGQQIGHPRWAVAQAVRRELPVAGQREGTGFVGGEDAGRVNYAQLRPQQLWQLRQRIGQALSAARPAPKTRLVEFRTPPRGPAVLSAGRVLPIDGPAGRPGFTVEPDDRPGTVRKALVLNDPALVRDVLLEADNPNKLLGKEGRNNALKKRDRSDAFLVRFELDRLGLKRGMKIRRATLSFFVWDPSSQGKTKVCAFALKTGWDEATACAARPAEGKTWAAGEFDLARDAGPASPAVIVQPDGQSDTADPPIEYQLDVTQIVQAWLDGRQANHGVAIAPVSDRLIDEGYHTRFQIYAREYRNGQYAPRLQVVP